MFLAVPSRVLLHAVVLAEGRQLLQIPPDHVGDVGLVFADEFQAEHRGDAAVHPQVGDLKTQVRTKSLHGQCTERGSPLRPAIGAGKTLILCPGEVQRLQQRGAPEDSSGATLSWLSSPSSSNSKCG